jgi:hypothetical protein
MVEIQTRKSLLGRVLQVLHNALIPGIVAQHNHELRVRANDLPGLVNVENSSVVGQRMDDHRGVFARLDDLVQITDPAIPYGQSQRPVLPYCLIVCQQKTAHQIRCGQIFVAGHGHQRQFQVMGHVFDEPGFAAPCRALDDQGNMRFEGMTENLLFIPLRYVVRLEVDTKLIDDVLGVCGRTHGSLWGCQNK